VNKTKTGTRNITIDISTLLKQIHGRRLSSKHAVYVYASFGRKLLGRQTFDQQMQHINTVIEKWAHDKHWFE
jgi:hypothetical protein